MLKGSYVALVTPFKNNEIDYIALENLIEFHLQNATDGILFCGTTGESPALAGDEKERLVNFGLQKINGKAKVMMGTGTNNLSHTIAATARAKEWGVDSALVITPYYNKPTQQGLYLYFKAVAESTDIPIVIYNVPGRTGVNISAETTIRLAHEFENIVGIKEASGDLVQVSQIIHEVPNDFAVLSGEDDLNYPILCCGGSGVISVTANVIPDQVSKLVHLVEKRSFEKAREIHLQLLELNAAMFYETNPIPVKEALHLMKKIEREFRAPMCEIQTGNLEKLKTVLNKYGLI